MSDTTKIEWAEHTGGPWLGCTHVSPGCANCYACGLATTRHEHFFRRAYQAAGLADWATRPVWGDKAPRVLTKGFWQDARRIHARHVKAGTRGRWFPSLIDWLDEMPAGIMDQAGKWLDRDAVLADFLGLVRETPSLDWMLLTKRPENWEERLLRAWALIGTPTPEQEPFDRWLQAWRIDKEPPSNVWIGASTEDQARADARIPALLKIPAVVRFLSCEPLLGRVLLDNGDASFLTCTPHAQERIGADCCMTAIESAELGEDPRRHFHGIDWVIAGGESGHKARPMHPDWARSLRDQCAPAGVAFFFKQWGEWMPAKVVEPKAGELRRLELSFPKDGPLGPKNPQWHDWPDGEVSARVGKKAAGRLLDGVEYGAFPGGATT